MTGYFLLMVAALLSFFQLAKDWDKHETHFRRAAVFALILLTLGISAYQMRSSNNKNQVQHDADQNRITELQAKVDAGIKVQADNATLFLSALNNLQPKVADLQTQVKTESLQKQVLQLEEQLASTRQALKPGPKATLILSHFLNSQYDEPIALKDLSAENNVVHIPLELINDTEVDTGAGFIAINICRFCIWEKAEGFEHPQNSLYYQRNFHFSQIAAKTKIPISLDVAIPGNAKQFDLSYSYRCSNCALPADQEAPKRRIVVRVLGR